MFGARVGGRWCPTKKALKEALAANPASVEFEQLTELRGLPGTVYTGVGLPFEVRLNVVGPTPSKRIWSANVMRKQDGTIRVS